MTCDDCGNLCGPIGTAKGLRRLRGRPDVVYAWGARRCRPCMEREYRRRGGTAWTWWTK